jgi:hypothetical protein
MIWPAWSGFGPRSGHWIPLLVLNGTSEATGGRIVTTALAATYKPKSEQRCSTAVIESGCTLFVEADRFHDLLTYGEVSKKRDETFDDGDQGWSGVHVAPRHAERLNAIARRSVAHHAA